MKLKTKKYLLLVSLIISITVFSISCTKSEGLKESVKENETGGTVQNVNGLGTTSTVKAEDEENISGTTVDMVPIETELDGKHKSMFVVTIAGKKYRYRMASIQSNSLTVGEMIYKWDKLGNVFEFYTLKEHPDYKYLYCMSKENGYENEFMIEYAPATGLPEGSLDEIISDGFVVMKNGSVISGEDKWLEFVKKTESKEPAEIRIAYYFTLHGRIAKDLYELTQMDYPEVYFNRLKYDGENFIFTPLQKSEGSDDKYVVKPNDENNWEETYKYMKRYTEGAPSDTALYNTFDKYVLVNDDTLTWDDIWNGMISSDFGAGVKSLEVFNKYNYKDGVDPDEVILVDI